MDIEKRFEEAFHKLDLKFIKPKIESKEKCVYCGDKNPDFAIDGKFFHIECYLDPNK